jgi:hypothetical protein
LERHAKFQRLTHQETIMHSSTCQCPACAARRSTFEVMEFGPPQGAGEYEYESAFMPGEAESPFSEAEEIALAGELLAVSNEEELEQFLGSIWKGIKKVGSFVGRVAKPFSGVLKAVAKKALPFVGGALGSLIPIPGVGTAVGSALGGALSKALEMEFSGLEAEDREFEMARRFVRIAGATAQQAAKAPPHVNPQAAVETALIDAAREHAPQIAHRVLDALAHRSSGGPRAPGMPAYAGAPRAAHAPYAAIPPTEASASGTWVRRGPEIVVFGA